MKTDRKSVPGTREQVECSGSFRMWMGDRPTLSEMYRHNRPPLRNTVANGATQIANNAVHVRKAMSVAVPHRRAAGIAMSSVAVTTEESTPAPLGDKAHSAK